MRKHIMDLSGLASKLDHYHGRAKLQGTLLLVVIVALANIGGCEGEMEGFGNQGPCCNAPLEFPPQPCSDSCPCGCIYDSFGVPQSCSPCESEPTSTVIPDGCFTPEELGASECLAQDLIHSCETFLCGFSLTEVSFSGHFLFPPPGFSCNNLDCETLSCAVQLYTDLKPGPRGMLIPDIEGIESGPVAFNCFDILE